MSTTTNLEYDESCDEFKWNKYINNKHHNHLIFPGCEIELDDTINDVTFNQQWQMILAHGWTLNGCEWLDTTQQRQPSIRDDADGHLIYHAGDIIQNRCSWSLLYLLTLILFYYYFFKFHFYFLFIFSYFRRLFCFMPRI